MKRDKKHSTCMAAAACSLEFNAATSWINQKLRQNHVIHSCIHKQNELQIPSFRLLSHCCYLFLSLSYSIEDWKILAQYFFIYFIHKFRVEICLYMHILRLSNGCHAIKCRRGKHKILRQSNRVVQRRRRRKKWWTMTLEQRQQRLERFKFTTFWIHIALERKKIVKNMNRIHFAGAKVFTRRKSERGCVHATCLSGV